MRKFIAKKMWNLLKQAPLARIQDVKTLEWKDLSLAQQIQHFKDKIDGIGHEVKRLIEGTNANWNTQSEVNNILAANAQAVSSVYGSLNDKTEEIDGSVTDYMVFSSKKLRELEDRIITLEPKSKIKPVKKVSARKGMGRGK